MSGVIRGASITGLTIYVHIVDVSGQRWNGTAFEAYNAADYALYSIATTEQGSSGVFTATFPALIEAGLYNLFFYRQLGASPAEGDSIAGTAQMNWDGTDEIEDASPDNTTPALIIATAPGHTIYGQIINRAGQRWNATLFEAYAVAHYSSYALTMTENGATGVYLGTFPTALNQAGTYEVIFYLQAGASPASGDFVIGSSRIILASTGAMTGEQFYDYLLRTFIRTDKETEAYEAVTDTVREMRERYPFGETEVEAAATDLITVLGDYKFDVERDFGLRISTVLVQDGYTNSWPLNPISKEEFDRRYPNPTSTNVAKSPPVDYCVFGGEVLLGPVPDRVTYTYHTSYSTEDRASVVAATTSVPFAGNYRETLKFGTLSRLFELLEQYEKAAYWGQRFEGRMQDNIRREEKNKGVTTVCDYKGV